MRVLADASIATVKLAHVCRWIVRWLSGRRGDVRGVRVVVLNARGHVLMVRHTYAPFVWMLPGGGIDTNENSSDAAVREIGEETGIIITSPIPRGIKKGWLGKYDTTEYFVAKTSNDTLPQKKNFEILETKWFEKKDLPENSDPIHCQEIEKIIDEELEGIVQASDS